MVRRGCDPATGGSADRCPRSPGGLPCLRRAQVAELAVRMRIPLRPSRGASEIEVADSRISVGRRPARRLGRVLPDADDFPGSRLRVRRERTAIRNRWNGKLPWGNRAGGIAESDSCPWPTEDRGTHPWPHREIDRGIEGASGDACDRFRKTESCRDRDFLSRLRGGKYQTDEPLAAGENPGVGSLYIECGWHSSFMSLLQF